MSDSRKSRRVTIHDRAMDGIFPNDASIVRLVGAMMMEDAITFGGHRACICSRSRLCDTGRRPRQHHHGDHPVQFAPASTRLGQIQNRLHHPEKMQS